MADNVTLQYVQGQPIMATEQADDTVQTQIVKLASYGSQQTLISQFLDTNGNGTGTINANGNYSGAADIFYIQPLSTDVYRISSLTIQIEDSLNSFDTNTYGGATALSNGITLRVVNDSQTVLDVAGGQTINDNAEWLSLAKESQLLQGQSTGEVLRLFIDFDGYGQQIRLDGANNERLELTVNDDLTGLLSHTFFVRGYKETVSESS